MTKLKIYPVFIHFDPKENENIKLNFKFPETVNIPIFYNVSHNNNTMELSIRKINVKIETIVDKIITDINGCYLSKHVKIDPFDGERANFLFSNIDEFLDYYRENRSKFWYLKYIFTCPFSLLFCHNNEQYADKIGKGFPDGGLILYIPRNDYPDDSSTCDYSYKLNKLQRFQYDKYDKSFDFFDSVNGASENWIQALHARIRTQVPELLQFDYYASGGRYDEINPF